MTGLGIAQALVYTAALFACAIPLGLYMAGLFEARLRRRRWLGAPERAFLRLLGTSAEEEQDWVGYARSVLALAAVGGAALYVVLRLQGHLPLNPQDFGGLGAKLALHTAVSFVSSTNWQFYAGESTMSYLSQMAGLAVQNFIAPAVGLSVLLAFIRGLVRRSTAELGNFWLDFYRSLVYVLLPIAVVSTVILVSQGVPQTLSGYPTATTLEGTEQEIARGPVATQVAIRTLGTNGGGFYNSNGAVPFENPNGFSNVFLLLLQLLLPAASVFMYGRMVRSQKQALAILGAMVVLYVAGIGVTLAAEQHGSQVLRSSGVDITLGDGSSGGNMEGKETRFGIAGSALFTSATTASSGSGVDNGHDSLTPAGGGVALVNMFVGIFGGAGSGLVSMLLRVIVAVFVGGLMVGRTPEYLGKKIETREVKLTAVALFVPLVVLAATAVSVVTPTGLASIFNPGPHGFSEALYAYTSMANNNGSAFAGYAATDLSLLLGTVVMFLGRFVPILAALALAGSLAAKRTYWTGAGTLRTNTPTFSIWLLFVVVTLSGLTLLPALALGPIVEGLS